MSWEIFIELTGMPTPIHEKNIYYDAQIIQQELDYEVHQQLLIVDRDAPSLITQQHTISITIMFAVNDHMQYPNVFFIDGLGAQVRQSSTIHLWVSFVHRENCVNLSEQWYRRAYCPH